MTTADFLARLDRLEIYDLGILYAESDNDDAMLVDIRVRTECPEVVEEYLETIPFHKLKKVIKDSLQSLTDKGIPHSHYPQTVALDAKLGGE